VDLLRHPTADHRNRRVRKPSPECPVSSGTGVRPPLDRRRFRHPGDSRHEEHDSPPEVVGHKDRADPSRVRTLQPVLSATVDRPTISFRRPATQSWPAHLDQGNEQGGMPATSREGAELPEQVVGLTQTPERIGPYPWGFFTTAIRMSPSVVRMTTGLLPELRVAFTTSGLLPRLR